MEVAVVAEGVAVGGAAARHLTLRDFVDGAEGRAHPAAEQPLPKGRRRLVEHLEEGGEAG